MEEIFISNIHINKVRHLENIDIILSDTERKHLILTGRNGSGKTSVLHNLRIYLELLENNTIDKNVVGNRINVANNYWQTINNQLLQIQNQGNFNFLSELQIENYIRELKKLEFEKEILNSFLTTPFIEVTKNFSSFNSSNMIRVFFNAKRETALFDTNNITKINLNVHGKLSTHFLEYIVSLNADRLFAKEEGNHNEVSRIEDWFKRLQKCLQIIFDDENLKLKFERNNGKYNFIIELDNKKRFDFNSLSDGYSAIIRLVTEIIMLSESKSLRYEDIRGIVMIDEIETHLHIDLQKKILPFLTTFFPKIQFIVTTHSPFVLSSIPNAVIFDLETQERIEDLSQYSVDAIIKGYFDVDKYSAIVSEKITRYEELLHKDKNLQEKEEMYKLEIYFEELPKFLAPEFQLKINQLKLSQLAQ